MTNSTVTRAITTSFYTSHVSALLAYLKTDGDLAETFAHHVQDQWSASNATTTIPHRTFPYLQPKDREEAVRVANWLLQTLPTLTSHDARSAITLLQTWAQHYQKPKAVVFGIVGFAIIGPTLGLIKKNKQRNSVMRIIVTDTYYKSLGKKELAKFTAQHTGVRLAEELKSAAGNALQLHPETFDWTFSDHEVDLFAHNEKGLGECIATLEEDHLPHTVITEDDQIVGVVISPMVHEDFVSQSGAKTV